MEEQPLSTDQPAESRTPVLLQISNMISEAEPKRASDPTVALQLTDQALELAKRHALDQSHEYAATLLLRCKILTEFSNYADAMKAGSEALHIAELHRDERQIKAILLAIANIYGYQGIYDEAINFMHKAIYLFDQDSTESDEQVGLARSLNNLGYTYVLMNDAQSGLPHLLRSLAILRKVVDKEMLSRVLDSLSNAYLSLNDLDQALPYALEAHQIALDSNHLSVMAISMAHAAKIYIKLNELRLAEDFLKRARTLATANQFLLIEAQVYQLYAELEQRKGRPEVCIDYLQKALTIATTIDRKHHIADLLGDIARYYKQQGDFDQALTYTERHHAAREVYFNQQSSWRLKNLEIAYDVAQIKRDNELMHQKNLALQKEIRNQQLAKYSEQLETEVKLRTAELEQSNQQLKSALLNIEHNQRELANAERMAAVGSIVVGIAHELNTPVGNAMLVAGTLEDAARQLAQLMQTNTLRRSDLSIYLEQSAQSLHLLIKNLGATVRLVTNFQQIATTRETEDRRSFLLHQLIKEIESELASHGKEFSVAPSWQISEQLTLVSYPRALVQVLVLLIENAELHAFEGRNDNQIRVTAELQGDQVAIEVSDNGIGMNPELMTHIFDPFFTTKLGNGGNGLGLSIIFNLVKNILAGEIQVRSRVGVGTSFTLTIPRVTD